MKSVSISKLIKWKMLLDRHQCSNASVVIISLSGANYVHSQRLFVRSLKSRPILFKHLHSDFDLYCRSFLSTSLEKSPTIAVYNNYNFFQSLITLLFRLLLLGSDIDAIFDLFALILYASFLFFKFFQAKQGKNTTKNQ